MQYDAKNPKEYLTQLEDDWRKEKLIELRNILISQNGIEEGINYKMLGYSDEKGVVFHLNAQKNYVALYVGDVGKVDPVGDLLTGIDHGKGCLRFKKFTSIPDTQIEAFIKKSMVLRKKGEDVGC